LPRFSVIVPAYKVQAYGPECPDAVPSRSWPDPERALERRRPMLFRRTAGRLATVSARRDRPPRAARAGFLRTARAHCRHHRVPDLAVPLLSRLRHAPVHLGPHRTFRALRHASVLARRGVRGLVRLLRATRSAALRLRHRVRRPLAAVPRPAGSAAVAGRV
jgi:CRISPR system Cascade subunit CasB